MPVPTWLSTDPAEPKLPARTRPGWSPRPGQKVKLMRGWEVPEGAGQDEAQPASMPDYISLLGSYAAQSPDTGVSPGQPPINQPAPPSTIQRAQPVFQTAAVASQPSLGQLQDMLGGAPAASTDTSSTDVGDTTKTSDMSTSGAQSSGLAGPQPKSPGDWIDQARQAAAEAGIDPDVFTRQIQQESGFNPSAKSPAGAIGIAQIMPDTAKGWGVDPTDPKASLRAAAKADAQYLKDYNGDWRLALAAYNAGPGNVAKYGGVPPFAETQSYVKTIYGSGSPAPATRASGSGGGGDTRSVLGAAQSALGTKYQFGGAGGRTATPSAQLSPTDCSGFVSWAYQQAGVKLTPQTNSIWQQTTAIDANQARPGDLVMYNMDQQSDRLQHVGIYVGNGQMIHDSSANPNGGVAVTPLWANPSFRRVPGTTPEQLAGVAQDDNSAPSASASASALSLPTRDHVTSWQVVAHAGRQMLIGEYASGKPLVRDLGKTAKPDGTVLNQMTPEAQAHSQAAQINPGGLEQPADDTGDTGGGNEAAPTRQMPASAGVGIGAGQEADDRQPTLSKREASYTKKATEDHCQDCSMFRSNSCTLVKGYIHDRGSCDFFEPKKMGAGQDEGDTTDQPPPYYSSYVDPSTGDTVPLAPPSATTVNRAADLGWLGPEYAPEAQGQRAAADDYTVSQANIQDESRFLSQQQPSTASVVDAQRQVQNMIDQADIQNESQYLARQQGGPSTQPQDQLPIDQPGRRTAQGPASLIPDVSPSALQTTAAKVQTPSKPTLGTALGAVPFVGGLAGALPQNIQQSELPSDIPTPFGAVSTQAAGTAASAAGTAVQTAMSPFGSQSTEFPTGGPAAGPGYGVERGIAGDEQLAAENPEYASLIQQKRDLNAQLPEIGAAAEVAQGGPDADRITAINDQIHALDQRMQEIRSQTNTYELAARNPKINSYETEAGLLQGAVAAGVGGVAGAAGVPKLAVSALQTAVDPLTGLPSLPGHAAEALGNQAVQDALRSRQVGGGYPFGPGKRPEKLPSAEPVSSDSLAMLANPDQLAVTQAQRPIWQVQPLRLGGDVGQNLKDAGVPEVVTAYRVRPVDAGPETSTFTKLSLERPSVIPPGSTLDVVSVPRDDVVGLNRATGEATFHSRWVQPATSAEKFLANGGKLDDTVTGPVADRLRTTLEAPISDEERSSAQRLLDEYSDQGRGKGSSLNPYPATQSVDSLVQLQRQLRALADLGESEKDWYAISSRKILEATGGNKQDAEKIARLVAAYSPNTPVSQNLDYALTAWSQWKAGKPIEAPTMGDANERATRILVGNEIWDGVKTNNFYRNLMQHIDDNVYRSLGQVKDEDGVMQSGVTIDIWMQRALNSLRKAPGTQGQYDFASRLVSDVAVEKGWSPEQAQAAIWSAAKMGWEYQKNARSIEEAGFNYGTAIEQRMARGFGATDAVVDSALRDENGRDILAEGLGLLGGEGKFPLSGARQTGFSQALGREMTKEETKLAKLGAVQPDAKESANAYAAIRGWLSQFSGKPTDESGWARIFPSPTQRDANAAVVDIGRPPTADEISQLEEHLGSQSRVVPTDTGLWVLDVGAARGAKAIVNDVNAGLEKIESIDAGQATHARYDGQIHTNDWSTSPNGEDYLAPVRQSRSGIADWFAANQVLLRQRVQTAAEAAARQPGAASAHFAATLGGGAAGGVAGYTTSDQNATPEERLARAALFAAGGAALSAGLVEGLGRALAPSERAAAIRTNLPPELRDTPAGQAIVRQVSAAADPAPILEHLANTSSGIGRTTYAEHLTVDGTPLENLPRSVAIEPYDAAKQTNVLQRAALNLNDQQLLNDSRAARDAPKHEPLSPGQLRTAVEGAVKRQNPEAGPSEVAERTNEVLRGEAPSAGRDMQRRFLRDAIEVPLDDPRPVAEGMLGGPMDRRYKYVYQNSIADLLPENSTLYHETSVPNARKLVQRTEEGYRQHTPIWTSDNRDLALGQAGRGVVLEFEPTLANGSKSSAKPGLAFSEATGQGGEYTINRTARGAVKSIVVRNQRQADQLATNAVLARRFDFANATPAENGGLRIVRRSPSAVRGGAQTGAATTKFALALGRTVAGGVAGEKLAEAHTAEDDPNRMLKLAGGAIIGGMLGGGLPYYTGYLNKSFGAKSLETGKEIFNPVLTLKTDASRKLAGEFAGNWAAGTLAGRQYTEGGKAVFGDAWNAKFAAWVEEHNALPGKGSPFGDWASNPKAQAFLDEWRDVVKRAPAQVDMAKKINFADPTNPANLYLPHVTDKDWKDAQAHFPVTDAERSSAGYGGAQRNPFYSYKKTRQYQSMTQGMNSPQKVVYTDQQLEHMGFYKGRAYQEEAVKNLAKGLRSMAKSKSDPELITGLTDLQKTGAIDLGTYSPRFKGIYTPQGSAWANVMNNWFGKSDAPQMLTELGNRLMNGAGLAKHNLLGLSGFHTVQESFQFARVLPGGHTMAWKAAHTSTSPITVAGKTVGMATHAPSAAAVAARYALELPATPVRFANEMRLAAGRVMTRDQFARWVSNTDPTNLMTASHVLLPGNARAFTTSNAAGMLLAAKDGLTLNMNTAHNVGLKAQVGLALLNGIGGAASGYQLGTTMGLSPEQSALMAFGGFALGASTPLVPWKLTTPLSIPTPFRGQVNLINNVNEMLFSRFIPYLKYRTYELYKPAIGGHAAAEFANTTYGGENVLAAARSRNVQNLMRVAALAPDWWVNWAKQAGHAMFNWSGPTGDMSRLYWASTFIGGATALELGNLALGGHWSWENDPTGTLQIDMSKLYDTLHVNRTDPATGVQYRPYLDFLGPIRGFMEPLQEVSRASVEGIMRAYNITPPPEIAGNYQLRIPHPDPVGAVGRFIESRSGLLPRSLQEIQTGLDYTGRSVDVAGDPAYLNAARRTTQALSGLLPVGPSQISKSLVGGDPGPIAALSGVLGFRVSHTSDTTRHFQMLDQWMADNGISPEAQRTLQEQRTFANQKVTDTTVSLLNNPDLTPYAQPGHSRSEGMIDQIISAQRQRVQEYSQLKDQLGMRFDYHPETGAPAPPGYEEQLQDLKTLFGGVVQGGTDAPSDLSNRGDVNPDELFQMAWQVPASVGVPQKLLSDVGITAPDWLPNIGAQIDPNDQKALNKAHMEQVQQVAAQWNIDPAVMEDVVKAHLYGDNTLPELPNVSSAELDNIVADYSKLSIDLPPGAERSQKQQKLLQDYADAHQGVDLNALRQRVIWRELPMTEQPKELKTYSQATNLDMRVTPYRYAQYDDNGKLVPWGTVEQEKAADQSLAQLRRDGRVRTVNGMTTVFDSDKYTPNQKYTDIAQAAELGKAAREQALQADPQHAAYDRYYGRGKYLTESQWQQFQAGTLPGAFADIGDKYPGEFKSRIKILNYWNTLTPEERTDFDIAGAPLPGGMIQADEYTGQLGRSSDVSLIEAVKYLTRGGRNPSPGRLQLANLSDQPDVVE